MINLGKFQKQNELSRKVLDQNRGRGQHTFSFDGVEFDIDQQVFSPAIFNAWSVFTPWLASQNFDEFDMLEIGCGSGITGLYLCKKKGLHSIVLSDISSYAVRNTRKNARKLGLEDKTKILQSDVFDSIPMDQKFDVVYWNHPWLPESESYRYPDEIDRGLFDPGYKYLKKYLEGARNYLKQQGRIFLGFGDFGDEQELRSLCDKYSYQLIELVRQNGAENGDVTFVLYELVPLRQE